MFRYYFLLGLRSLRRNPALTALMVLTLAVGVAASVTTLTILHVMSGDPIPHKSARLFTPLLDNGPLRGYTPGDKPNDTQLSYRDVVNLLAGRQGERRSALYGINATIEPARADLVPRQAGGQASTRDFFAMFEAPFRYGQAWSEADDAAGADVVVLSRGMAELLFGAANPVGRRLRLLGHPFQIVGVLEHWRPLPRYYRMIGGDPYGNEAEFMLPLASAIRHQTTHSGGMSCSSRREPGWQALLESECTWFHFWFETRSGAGRAELQNYLDNYTAEQRRLGRFQRAAPNRLLDVMQWLEYLEVVGKDNKLSAWLAFGFLLLCLVNTIGLLLAKFSVRAAEVGIRRALGASRRQIFRQFMIETSVIGVGGGLLGVLFAYGALALIGRQSSELEAAARMDWLMLLVSFVLALAAALLAGLLPTWRACQVTPALQLKSQ